MGANFSSFGGFDPEKHISKDVVRKWLEEAERDILYDTSADAAKILKMPELDNSIRKQTIVEVLKFLLND